MKTRTNAKHQKEKENVMSPLETARIMQSKRTNDYTKQNYRSKINIVVKWMKQNYPTAVDRNTQLLIPTPKEAVLQFFGHLSLKAAVLSKAKDDEVADLPTPMSVSGIRGYRSALVDMYRTKSKKLDPKLDMELNSMLDGYEKAICELKQRGRMQINEGKRHLKWSGYGLLVQKFMKKTPTEGENGRSWSTILFGWAFCVIMWNLMSRTDSVDSLMLQHIDWDGDALIIEEQGHKGDQTGENKYGKHIYANPDSPEKCPILSLGVFLFCFPDRPNGKQQLFAGTNSKDRFCHLLTRLLHTLDESEAQMLGCPIEDIGTHSLRKGSSTFALGQVCGPTPVSVFLRMGQTLGQLKDRYIHSAEGADQLCGRMVAGLPFDSEKFTVLPPHFPSDLLYEMNDSYWTKIFSGYIHLPTGMKNALPFFLGSVIYHEAFLRENLHTKHPIFFSRVFTNNPLLQQMRSRVLLGLGRCPYTDMRATGIPPHLALVDRIYKLTEQTQDLRKELSNLKNHLSEVMPERVATTVTEQIQESFVIEGVAPVSLKAIDRRLNDLEERIVSRIAAGAKEREVVVDDASATWKTWQWGDGLLCHFVPKDWEFPARLSVKMLWDLWWFGDRSTGIRPFKDINFAIELKEEHRMRFSRAKSVVEYCLEVMQKLKLLPEEATSVAKLSLQESDEIFHRLYEYIIDKLYDERPGRPMELSYGTIYNLKPKKGRKRKSR